METSRSVIVHTFDEIGLTLFELPENPGQFSTYVMAALNGKSMGIIDLTSTKKITDNSGKKVKIHPSYESISDIYELNRQYKNSKVWKWTKISISAISDVLWVLKAGASALKISSNTIKNINISGKVVGDINNFIAVGEATYGLVVEEANLYNTVINLGIGMIPIIGTGYSLLQDVIFDDEAKYLLYYTSDKNY